MAYLMTTLKSKEEVDDAIQNNIDKVLVLRFGSEKDPNTLQLDDIVSESFSMLDKTYLHLFSARQNGKCFEEYGYHISR